MDIYWITKGGGDPAGLLRQVSRADSTCCTSRTWRTDGSMTGVGTGTIDWKPILSASRKAGVRHYFAELDDPVNPISFARASYDFLREIRW